MGAAMRNVLGRLLILVAEALDRSLMTVPEIDDYDSPSTAATIETANPR
jgi:hypothetical protein